ncbi:MAG: 6,7-dimethyl-8-ribityllumazine synthase [Gammaproteobacteria bacterium TMED78]|nr:MAG: 6,7-dimethyl-8-ribityllumazine synthase [Gammaproteobacteria bacterium TMED78]|tara:strand:- start:339 stop:821 length:483 start_codon:yes stop_codon:yes gene_type:complete
MEKKIKIISGQFDKRGLRIGIVASKFNDFIVDKLLSGAIESLVSHGVELNDIQVIKVPGAFEIPVTLKKLAISKRFDGLIALGCIIRGDTAHFDYVATEASSGIASVMKESLIPIGFGLLTVDNVEQAIKRAGSKSGNKGIEAAITTLEMISILRELDSY